MLISVLTGFLTGALHVVGEADHLVAMAPLSIRKPAVALRSGLEWGLGHSTGVVLISVIAITAKDLVHIERMSSWAEFSVGVGLLVVGALAIRTALGLDIHTHRHQHRDGSSHEHMHLHLGSVQRHGTHPHAVTSLGLLHGLAGATHILAILPALALPPLGAVAYVIAYLIGSVAAMGAVVLAISLASVRAGKRSLPMLFGLAGGLSIATGFFWIQRTSAQIL